jgi:hypothetical protein
MFMQRIGFLLTAIGVLIIGGYYTFGLLIYLFSLEFLPFPVRAAIPLVAAGVVLTITSLVLETVKKNRKERIEDVEDRITEYETESEFLGQQLIGSND